MDRFDELRQCWEQHLLGSGQPVPSEYRALYLASIDRMADPWLDPMASDADALECKANDAGVQELKVSDAGVPELKVTVSLRAEAAALPRIYYLRALAMAYRTEGSRFYQDAAVRDTILEGLDCFYEEEFNPTMDPGGIGNWWFYQIGMPLRFLDILTLLYDELDALDGGARVMRLTEAILHFKDAQLIRSGGKKETGANLMWKCKILLLTGILRKESTWIDWALERLPSLLVWADGSGSDEYRDGFYPDGSFIQHYVYYYAGGYGVSFLGDVTDLITAFHGQGLLRLGEGERSFLEDIVRRIYLPILYKGHVLDLSRGREVTRRFSQDDQVGAALLRSLVRLRRVVSGHLLTELTARLKEELDTPQGIPRLLTDAHPGAGSSVSGALLEALADLVADVTGPAAPMTGHFELKQAAKLIHREANYCLAMSMYSRQIACYERMNDDGLKTWHISDGMMSLYTGNGDMYDGDYYATADMQRLAGTTVERTPDRYEAPYYEWLSPEALNAWDPVYGQDPQGHPTVEFRYEGQGRESKKTLKAHKTWTFLGDSILCRGDEICSQSGDPVETILVNDRLVEGAVRFRVFVGEAQGEEAGGMRIAVVGEAREAGAGREIHRLRELTELVLGQELVLTIDRLFVQQEGPGDPAGPGNGYRFPAGTELHILLEERQGTWNRKDPVPGDTCVNTHLTVWLDHGRCPDGASYEYVLTPAVGEMEEWMK